MHEGVILNKAAFLECVDTYYAMMGWGEYGVSTKATLYDYGLDWALE